MEMEVVPEAKWSLGIDLISWAGPRCLSGQAHSPDNQSLFPSSSSWSGHTPPAGYSTGWMWY